jgi:hypothetical protein
VVELPYRWRREKYELITDWSAPSGAMVSALSWQRQSEAETSNDLLSGSERMLKR